MMRFWPLLAAGLIVLAPAEGMARQTRVEPVVRAGPPSELELKARRLDASLGCPVCQGQALADSPSEMAQEMRALIREQLAAGLSDEGVRTYFTSKYGEWIVLDPEPSGLALLLYLLPVAGLVGGAVLVLVKARRWTARPPES